MKDMIDLKFGKLKVISKVDEKFKYGVVYYNVICDCGKEKIVRGGHLRSGQIKSCGKTCILFGHNKYSNLNEFSKWRGMLSRCYNPNNIRYKDYGLRGVTVCDSWRNSFESFYSDMGNSNNLTLDRIDVNKGYCKENCRWADTKTQSRNKTNNVFITYNGDTKCVADWSEKLKISASTLSNRLKSNWDIDSIMKTPVRKYKK